MMDSQRTKGLWRTGKDEFKKFMKIKFKKSTNFVSYMFGILLTALPIFPIVAQLDLKRYVKTLYFFKSQ